MRNDENLSRRCALMKWGRGSLPARRSPAPEIAAAVKEAAWQEEMSVSQYVREAVKQALKRSGVTIAPRRRPASADTGASATLPLALFTPADDAGGASIAPGYLVPLASCLCMWAATILASLSAGIF
jgi:hypothetical protein